jgi:hypothetical protein
MPSGCKLRLDANYGRLVRLRSTAQVGVAVGIAGNGYLDHLRERQAAKRERDRVMVELLTATANLMTGVPTVRGAYQQ